MFPNHLTIPLRFAAPGSPISTPPPGGSLAGLDRCSELGISAIELEWVQSVPKSVSHIEEVGAKARDLDIMLTVHAPYFVNLNAIEKPKLEASKKRIIKALTMAQICGARSVCVHPAFYLGMDPKKVYENVRKATDEIMSQKELFPDVNLAFETMGKATQFGTLEEVLRLSKEFDIYPCVDTAHMHARSNGKWNSRAEFEEILDVYQEYLGKDSLSCVHFHYSGIEYGPKGERKHLPLKESDAAWEEFVKVLKERDVGGVCVCESPIGEEDVLVLKGAYGEVANG